jgi:hypothetical protein
VALQRIGAKKAAVEQADAADEAQGGTRTAGQGAALCPRGRNGRGHRFAADPQCSLDAMEREFPGVAEQVGRPDGPSLVEVLAPHVISA